MRAVRRNGGKAPSEPYPPFEPTAVLPSESPEMLGPAPHQLPVPARKPRRKAPKPRGKRTASAVTADAQAETPAFAPAKVTQLHVAITEDATVPVKVTVHPMVAAYKADLERIGQGHTRQGLQVVEMAEKLVSSATSPAAAANLSKELQRLMDSLEEAAPSGQVSVDPSVIIRERTLAKLRALAEDAAEAAS